MTRSLRTVSFLAALGIAATAVAADPDSAEKVTRRLSLEQYRQAITDAFGPAIIVGGRVEPDVRENGLLAIGAARLSVTATGLEQYDSLARSIAAQVMSERNRATVMPCTPASPAAADEKCAREFLASAGRLLYRRPLTNEELADRTAVAVSAATASKSFYAGLETALATTLVSPQFLFRHQTALPDAAGQHRLDAFSKASQISYFLWNAAPDPALLAAAESGALDTPAGLEKQVDRLIASPRLETGVRAFFSDMLGFDGLDALAKDPLLFRKYNSEVVADAREQTLRTLVDLLLRQKRDYRDIFTTRSTFLTPLLGSIYGVPVVTSNGGGWQPHEFPPGDPRGGIVAQISFLALHSHPGRSSPTLRGKALRELLLCQRVPDPPGNVNFTVVQDTNNPEFKTARERLTAHRTAPACAGCHKIMDPIGLAMENFDAIGEFRRAENGVPIDASGEMDGVKFADLAGLGQVLHNNPAATSCLVNKIYGYAMGRPATRGEAGFLAALTKDFGADGYILPALMRRIALSENLHRVAPPENSAAEVRP